MRAVMVLFDSLNRRLLPPYGAEGIHAPHFERLARRSVRFDTCYAGSMPCMPARRELHTGRHNFLHRSWGPLEPFDDSVPEMLSDAGVYTHLVTDHPHYWEDGGATYHTRFDTFEFFRGQEGDTWKGHVADPVQPDAVRTIRHGLWRQDLINRTYYSEQADHPQTLTVDAGLEFIDTNRAEDRWFLQIECFDPHEPYVSYAEHRSHYEGLQQWTGPRFDWPDYRRAEDDERTIEHGRDEYAALLSMCDASLGRILDRFDQEELWDDTLLIVCTDHGFLLGEHGWWGKNVQPWYDENIHTPLFVWDPRSRRSGERREALVQTIDLGPTLLEFFGVPRTDRMQGVPLDAVLAADEPVHDAALFGAFGAHVNVTDGRYVYMRAPDGPANAPLFEYTLMPTHMASRFTVDELRSAELAPPFDFTRGVPVLRVPGTAFGDPRSFGTVLFDLQSDPDQQHPVLDDELELRMIGLLLARMRAASAPASQYERLGLPERGPADASHLLARRQIDRYRSAVLPLPGASDFPTDRVGVNSPLGPLLDDPETAAIVRDVFGPAMVRLGAVVGDATLLDVAQLNPGIRGADLERADELLAAAAPDPSPQHP